MTILADDLLDVVGTKIKNPLPTAYQNVVGTNGGGLMVFLTNVLRLIFVVAGIYAFLNFIIAGFQYMSAAGDSKALSAAWDRIWQSFIGLIVIIASFALAALMGQLLFNNPQFILNPVLYGPGQ
jgi:hypothetical protein